MAFIEDIYSIGGDGRTPRDQDWEDTGVWKTESELDGEVAKTRVYSRQPYSYQGEVITEHDFAEDLVYNRIWINAEIDFDLIVEVRTDTVNLWNAYLYQTATITDFSDPGHTGISIETVTLPTTLQPNEEKQYIVTVIPSGPANQDTDYVFTVDGEEYTNTVIGVRILPFPIPANWVGRFSMEYGYETVVYTAPTSHEQRRSLIEDIRRSSSFSVLMTKIYAQKFENLYRKGVARFFGVPIHNEKFTTISTITAATSIIATEDITYFYNLNNLCDKVMIVDEVNLIGEIKVITGIVGQTISFEIEVTGTFDPNTSVLYPVFIGMLENANFKNVTDGVISSNVVFKEKFVG